MYTADERPKQRAAARAWDFFKAKYGTFDEIFFSPKADFGDSRSPGWTAHLGISSYPTTYGAGSSSKFRTHAVYEINEWHYEKEN